MRLFPRRVRTQPLRADTGDIELLTQQIGRALLQSLRTHRPGLLSSRAWSNMLMDWAMHDPQFKVQMFRFVDVFPMLQSDEQVHDVLLDYLSQPGVQVPAAMGLGLKAGGVLKGTLARTISAQITRMAENFIAGRDAASALPKLRQLWQQGVGFSVDLLGEACLSDAEADAYRRRYLDLLEVLPAAVAEWPAQPRVERDYLGPTPRCNVSIKISSLSARIKPEDFEGSVARLFASLRPILEQAARQQVLVNFDLEQVRLKDLTLALFRRCCEQVDFPAGIALQAYLRSGAEDARNLIDWARRLGRQITVRLIKGAYWDYEVIHAQQMGWPVPVWTRKSDTDGCFERMTEQFVEALPRTPTEGGVKLALGSHNVRSIARALALVQHQGLPAESVEFQLLEGMSDELKAALTEHGYRVRSYLPLGEMIPGMAYLVRRLLENTSNESWLRGSTRAEMSDEQLLQAPPADHPRDPDEPPMPTRWVDRDRLAACVPELDDGSPFRTEAWRDFANGIQREAFGQAVRQARAGAVIAQSGAAEVDRAIARAQAAWATWARRDVLERSQALIASAASFRRRRDELAAAIVQEAGKTWQEADADVCEAIDFCEYYARQAVALFRDERLGEFYGELNLQRYTPLGVAAIISPWNFPLAICTGMTTAALVTGNCALVKPSGQTPGVAQLMCQTLWEAGIPADVLHFVPGPGSSIGAQLIEDPRVSLIGFTGSREVGFRILEVAGRMQPGQTMVKKVVCEMGGKNAIIVDSTADLDEAVAGVRQSAFGYAGQKCSACSRVIVLDCVHDALLRRLIESTQSLTVGDPADPGSDVGPVIDLRAAQSIHQAIDVARRESRLELAVEPAAAMAERFGQRLIGPHIFSQVEPQHYLAREEIFGPVLAVLRASSFDQALELANDSVYKLTGAVYSRTPAHLDRARREFRVGNLYLNRGCTGALVGRQPFGGFGHSGVGTKAGGSDYLKHFVHPMVHCENTLRRGFAPGLES